MTRTCAIAAVASLALLSGVNSLSAQSLPAVTYKLLPAALSVEAAQAALAACKAQGYNVSVSVVDRLGLQQILIVGDNASPTGRWLRAKLTPPPSARSRPAN